VISARSARDCARDERGGVLVIVVVSLLSLALVAALVIDVANWFEHKRHLQLQADAAALAGGSAFQLPGCSNTAIYNAVRKYAGVKDSTYPTVYNRQVGGTPAAKAHVLVNSPNRVGSHDGFWPYGTDYTDQGPPCSANFVDVKMTEADLPWFFGPKRLVPRINARARVSMKLVSGLSGQLPIGVPDVNPLSGAVVFYDEANPNTLATTYAKYLRKVNTTGGLNEWANTDSTGSAVPASVTMPASGQLGVVLAFSSDGPPLRPPLPIANMTVTQICAQVRVDCYNAPASSGLLFMHGFSTAAAPANKVPIAKDATLNTTGGSACPGSYAYFTYNNSSCTATLSMTFATTITTLNNVQLTATPGGNCTVGGQGTMSGNGLTRTIAVTVPANAGPCPITVTWAVKQETGFGTPATTCGNNFSSTTCVGTFGIVQRVFGGDDDLSGPVRTAHLLNMGSSFSNPAGTCPGPLGWGAACNSLPINGTARNLSVDVQLAGAIATSASDPPVLLRIICKQDSGGNCVGGSRNGSLDCNRTGNLQTQISNGCTPHYTINTDPNLACPWNSKTAMLDSNLPGGFPCVAVQTGGSVGQFTQGIQDRILGGSNQCPGTATGPPVPGRNYWSLFPNLPDPSRTDQYNFVDPRIVYVFMVPFGSFRGSGSTLLPIVSFGVFYVTGWGGNGNGNDDPCPGADPAPKGDLAGHFITHVDTSANSTGTQPCVTGSFNPCVAILTE
jgi:Putative Flp pilus-assembly TadE/G-like